MTTFSAWVCTQCGWQGSDARTITKGSILIEFILWCAFLLPGLIYSVWRHTSRYKGCPKCGAPNLIPSDSPMARKILEGLK